MKKWNLAALALFGFIESTGHGSESDEVVAGYKEPTPASVTTEQAFRGFGELSQEHREILLFSFWTGALNEGEKRIVAMELGLLSQNHLLDVLTECKALPLKDFKSITQIIGKYIGNN